MLLKKNTGSLRLWLAALAALLTVILIYWMIRRSDQEMRNDLLLQTKLLGRALDVEQLTAFAGSKEDLDQPHYINLRRRLNIFKNSLPGCRFIYIMKRKNDGEIIFLVDTEPPESKDFVLPGHPYNDASEKLKALFDTEEPFVEGPLADAWGTWVSALVPIRISDTEVIVLGVDVAATDWQWHVAARTAIPAGLIILLFVGVLMVLAASHKRPATPQLALRRLLPPLTILLTLLPIGGAVLLLRQHRSFMNERIEQMNALTLNELQIDLLNQRMILEATLNSIVFDPRLSRALRLGNRDKLLAGWKSLYEILRKENSLEFFILFDHNRRCLLRFHDPEVYGDKSNRYTLLEAERTGHVVSGLDLDSRGIFRLRATRPVFDDDELIGYVELGKDIGDVLKFRHASGKLQLAVVVNKKYLDRQNWENGMRQLDKVPDWQRLPNSVVAYTSHADLPEAFLAAVNYEPESFGVHPRRITEDISFDDKLWRLSTFPLKDIAERNIATLLVMTDITAAKGAFNDILMIGGVACLVLLLALLAFVFILLRRTDAGILEQQAELRQREELLAATLHSIGDGVIRIDAEGRVAGLNRAAEALTGWSSVEASGKSLEEVFCIIDAETRNPVENPVSRVLSKVETVDLANHTTLIARDGTEYQIADSCSPILNDVNKVIGAVLVFRNVSEEYRQRAELRESEERLNQIAEKSRTVIWEVDANGLFTYVSEAAKSVFGYHPGELVNQMYFYDLHPESGREDFKKMVTTKISRQESLVGLLSPIRNKNGEIIWVSNSSVVMKNQDGSLCGCRGSSTDVTARKRSDEMLRNALEQANIATTAKSRFMANMSHELRTPMNGIIGMAELLATTTLSKEQIQYVEMLNQSGERMLKVINDVLDISAIEAGRMNLVNEPVNPRELLKTTLRPLDVAASKKGVKLIVDVAPDVPDNLSGDAGRIGQIITNLVANAVKFTEVGSITVSCALFEKDKDGARVQFTVEDTGMGIPQSEQQHLFEPFFQVDSSNTRKYGGSGLGLSICRQLAEMMNGDIKMSSTVGQGTTFTVTLYLLFASE